MNELLVGRAAVSRHVVADCGLRTLRGERRRLFWLMWRKLDSAGEPFEPIYWALELDRELGLVVWRAFAGRDAQAIARRFRQARKRGMLRP